MSQIKTYMGGKSGSGTYQTIINHIPPHSIYVEIFGGMLGIYRHKAKARSSFVFEKDTKLIQYYQSNMDIEAQPNLKDFLKRIEYGVRGSFCLEGCSLNYFNDGRLMRLLDRDDVFIYVDPPYPAKSRKSATKYRHELSDDDHSELLFTLNCFNNAKVALSSYPNELYSEYFLGRDHWHAIEFESKTRRGMATDQLWMNYEKPTRLHDYQYLGTDYRERERISRKLKRWEAKFQDLAPLEQLAMLQRLNKTLDPTNKNSDAISHQHN